MAYAKILFDKSLFKGDLMNDRINRLLALTDENAGVLISSPANIFYFSGFTSEDCLLYISRTRLALLTDSRYTVQAKLEAVGFEVIDKDILGYLQGIPENTILFEEDYLTAGKKQNLESKLSPKELISGQSIISSLRRIKDSGEIEKIKASAALADEAFEHILGFIKPGIPEVDIAFELEFFMRKKGAKSLAFDTICASGTRSSMPHGVASDKKIANGDFVTLDFGCVLEGYCSDMTRTVVIGNPDERQKEIYNLVKKAQQTALDALCPKLACKDADKVARDIIDLGGYGKNFGHSLGHSVGIEIHEAPNLSPKSKDVLSVGNVVTVEPGIYIDGFGGVRIEDLVVITPDGIENMTKSPKELLII